MKTLSGKQRKALAALVSGMTQQQAAQTAGVHETTLSRWMQEPGFRAELATAGRRVMETAGRKLKAYTEQSIDVLYEIMLDRNESGATRIRAANSIAALSVQYDTNNELAERLVAIETYLHELREWQQESE